VRRKKGRIAEKRSVAVEGGGESNRSSREKEEGGEEVAFLSLKSSVTSNRDLKGIRKGGIFSSSSSRKKGGGGGACRRSRQLPKLSLTSEGEKKRKGYTS